jgi:sugar (pentulose or hexulose) kinase
MVVKGITREELKDPGGVLYNHRHPEGYWMPGGASNIGADWITKDFNESVALMNEEAMELIPTGRFVYPLKQQGERFPFVAPGARGFTIEGLTKAETYSANLEAVAYIERYAYELIERLSGEKIRAVFTAGGASNSEAWLKVRSNVLNLPVYKMRHVTGAVGAAILAASQTYFYSLTEATRALTQLEKEIYPEAEMAKKYDGLYHRFIGLLQQKGFIPKEQYA